MSIRDVPFPSGLAPIAKQVSDQFGISLEVCEGITLHMNAIAADRLSRIVQDQVEGRGELLFKDFYERSSLVSLSNHGAVWLLLAKPLGIDEAVITEAVRACTVLVTDRLKADMVASHTQHKEMMKNRGKVGKNGG